jgi:hypothetical protein
MFYDLQYNNGSRFTGVALTPFVVGVSQSKEFCYGFGTSCANTGGLLPPKDIRIPSAPVITQGDTTDGGTTEVDTTTTTTTDTTKPIIPESSTPSLPPKDTSTTTKETIKKKY